MNAPMKAIVDFAANNVPAEWAAIINATTFNPEFECEDMRQFKGAEPVMRNADVEAVWNYGETFDTAWASELGYKGADDKLVVLAKFIKIVRGNKVMIIQMRRLPGVGFYSRITVQVKG